MILVGIVAGCGGDAGPPREHGRTAPRTEPPRATAPSAPKPFRRSSFPGPSQARLARVTRVTDGDTVSLSGVGKVRLIGVDTPEVFGGVECFGRAASEFTKRVLRPGRQVSYRLGVEPRDRYGRALAYVWLSDGRLFNGILVERGYAQPLTIPPNVDLAHRFTVAARRARRSHRGLWGRPGCADAARRPPGAPRGP